MEGKTHLAKAGVIARTEEVRDKAQRTQSKVKMLPLHQILKCRRAGRQLGVKARSTWAARKLQANEGSLQEVMQRGREGVLALEAGCRTQTDWHMPTGLHFHFTCVGVRTKKLCCF